MKGFSGFTAKGRLVKIPAQFFSELLPQIDHLTEMKVTLYCFWRLQQREGRVPFLRLRDMLADEVFLSGLGARDDERRAALREGLERAVARGTLLHVVVRGEGTEEDLYFMNTPRGHAAVRGIEEGRWQPPLGSSTSLDLTVERPNIFVLYEQNIGPLTPLIAEALRDLEKTYPQEWVEEAFRIAVERNARRLAYIQAILKRWQAEGRTRHDAPPTDGRRFISGQYREDIEY